MITFICFVMGIYQRYKPLSINDISAICNDKEYYENQFYIAYRGSVTIVQPNPKLDLSSHKVVSAKAIFQPESKLWECEYKVSSNQPVVSGYNAPYPEESVSLYLDLKAYCDMNYNKYIYSVCR